MMPRSTHRLLLPVALLAGASACSSHDTEAEPLPPTDSWVEPASPVASPPPERPSTAPSGNITIDSDRAVHAQLATTRVPGFVVVDEESLRSVMQHLSAASGVSIIVDERAEEAVLDEGLIFELDLEHPLSARNLLELIVSMAGDEVAWTVRHGVVLVTTADRARGPMVLGMYDVRSMTMGIADFAAPRMGRLHPDDDEVWDDPDAGSGGLIGRTPRIDEDILVDLVRDNVDPDGWDAEGASLDLQNGVLLVRNTEEVHARVRRFLRTLQ